MELDLRVVGAGEYEDVGWTGTWLCQVDERHADTVWEGAPLITSRSLIWSIVVRGGCASNRGSRRQPSTTGRNLKVYPFMARDVREIEAWKARGYPVEL